MSSDGSRKGIFRLTAFGGVLGVVRDGVAGASLQLDPCPREMLDALLEENRQYSPRLAGALTNHLSMALEALYELGASKERLRDFADHYRRKLLRHRPGEGIDPSSDWRVHVGDGDSYSNLVAIFAERLRNVGRDALLRDVLRTALEGPGTEAFHGMIRTAFAVRFEDDRDLPLALAYWIAHLDPLRAAFARRPRCGSPLEIFNAVAGRRRTTRRTKIGGIMRAMRAACAREEFCEFGDAFDFDAAPLDPIADAAIRLYLSAPSLTTLHAVTGVHAFRLLRPWMEKGGAAKAALFRAVFAAYLAAGAPPIEQVPSITTVVDWRTIASRAVPSDDEHDVKFVLTCREEERAYGGRLYRIAAALRLGFPMADPPAERCERL